MAPLACMCWLFAAASLCSVAGVRRKVRKHSIADSTYHLRISKRGPECEVLEATWGQVHRLAFHDVYASEPMWSWSDEEEHHSEEQIQDFWGPEEVLVRSRALDICNGTLKEAARPQGAIPASTEVRCIYCSGDSSNRIDVVLMGDGYIAAERDRFFEDMERLKNDMFADVTFSSYLPVLNLWAIHVPSAESGIGYHGMPKNTPFELYKQGTQHRAVWYTSAGRSNARNICMLAGGCDFPSLIGNDEFYGGLGGEFVIGTRSKTTGFVVLRHEMGHNFASVGDEYDNSWAYNGANSASSLQDIKWTHWLTEPDKEVKEQRQGVALAEYPWKDMAEGQQSFNFTCDGTYSSWRMSFTVSGFPEDGSLKVTLDGAVLDWIPSRPPGAEQPDGSTVDRQFYHFSDSSRGFSQGAHTLTFESMFSPPSDGPIRQLCSISIYEYGSAGEFNDSPGYIGAFPTWSDRGAKSYRPTNEQCLMRNMQSVSFCPVCKEAIWLNFLSRMTLIDEVEITGSAANPQAELKAVPLAHFRNQTVPGLTERYTVVWKKGGIEQSHLEDRFSFSGSAAEMNGNWEVILRLSTSEVRKDDQNLLTTTRSFTIGGAPTQAPTPPPPSCADSEANCRSWAGLGYCEGSSQYYQWMQQNCCLSCSRIAA